MVVVGTNEGLQLLHLYFRCPRKTPDTTLTFSHKRNKPVVRKNEIISKNAETKVLIGPGGCTPLSSRKPHLRQKNLFFLSFITKMDQNFINFFHE